MTSSPKPAAPEALAPVYTAQECAQRLRHLANHAVKGAEWIHTPLSKLYRRSADLLDASAAATPAPARLDAEAMRGLVKEWREDAQEDRAILRSNPSAHAYLYSAVALENCADALEAALPPQERADE